MISIDPTAYPGWSFVACDFSLLPLLERLRTPESSEQFMNEYRARRLVHQYDCPRLDAKLDAVAHLTLEEVRYAVDFAGRFGFSYDYPEMTFLREWKKVPLEVQTARPPPESQIYVDEGTIRHTDTGARMRFRLMRDSADRPNYLMENMECGHYQKYLPESHWRWLCQQGYFAPDACAFSRLIVDYNQCIREMFQECTTRQLLDGSCFYQVRALRRCQYLLSMRSSEEIAAQQKVIQQIDGPGALEPNLEPYQIWPQQSSVRYPCQIALETYIRALRQGDFGNDIAISTRCMYYPLLNVLHDRIIDLHQCYVPTDLNMVSGLAFALYFLLQSPARERVLKCFHPEHTEEMLRCLSLMNFEA